MVDSDGEWVSRLRKGAVFGLGRGGLVAGKLFARSSIPFAVLIGLALAAPAQAQDPVDVAALEARLEAAGELAELPTEPDWGVTDSVTPDPAVPQDVPAVPQDAPEVPVDSSSEPGADATEPRYHPREPQYHAEYRSSTPEYHSSTPESVAAELPPVPEEVPPVPEVAPPPVDDTRDTPVPVAAPPPTESPTAPSNPPSASSPPPEVAPTSAPATSSSAPTIWIWVWNWTWTYVGDGRYQNSGPQYQIDEPHLDKDVEEIVRNIGVEMPVQIDVRKGSDIVAEIQRGIAPAETVREVLAEAAKDTPLEDALVPPAQQPANSAPAAEKRTGAEPRTSERSQRTSERSQRRPQARRRATVAESPQHVLAEAGTSSATYFASGDIARASRHTRRSTARVRMHRAAAPKALLPTNEERFADSGTASGPNAGLIIKMSAILAAFLMLAALAYGRRIWLPASRLRGLLGSRIDPPG